VEAGFHAVAKKRPAYALFAVLLMAVALLGAGCGGSDTSSKPAASGDAAASKGDIVIGIAKARTGFMAQFDGPAATGAKMAIDDINQKGGVLGRKLKWIFADTKSDKGQAVVAATDLIAKGAKVLLVSCDFDYGGPSASVAQQENLLGIGCAGSPRFGKQGIGPNAFSLDTQTPDEGGTVAEWASQNQGWKTTYIITDTSIDYTKTLADYFETRWTQLNGAGSIVGKDTFLNDDPSIASQVSKLRSLKTKPDFIFLASCPPGIATAARQIRAAGIDTPIATGVCGDGDFWLKSVPNLTNFFDAAYVSTFLDDPRPEVNDFMKRFLQKMNDPPQRAFGVIGYSEVQAFARAVEKAGSLDTDKVRAALESFKQEPLLVGPTTFTPDQHGDIWRPMAILEVKNGTHKFHTQWTVKEPPPPKF
jgi:branched-chain amino acid transport system substrate-binding protein